MNYEAYIDLTNTINQEIKRLVNNLCFIIFLCITGSYVLYCVNGKILNPFYFFGEILFLGIMSYMQYMQIKPNIIVLNNTTIEVNILNEFIIVKTAPVNGLFWINKPSKELKFDTEEVIIRRTSYPLKKVYDLDNRAFKLTDKIKEIYIIADFFDKQLYEELTEIKNRT